ncbi:MAG TPA: universal stress protein [Planctomycetota bacterium]|nr:universal stress protein [Planctomycetota bacterium]
MDSVVLVALDGSTNAEKVLPYVEPLLITGKTRALLVQVLPDGENAPEAAAQAYLREISARLAKRKIQSDCEIAHGDPAVAIVRGAEKIQAGLVAFTSHGKGGLSQWVFGSVAQKILRGCSRPLLVVRALETPSERVTKVLLPLDGSAGSESILPHATALARSYDAPVELLHVLAESGVEAGDSKLRHWMGRERTRMNARFAEIETSAPDVRFSRLCEEGDAAERILARVEPGSVVAMANHGRSGLNRWIFGSVCEKILQAARCPVLIARTPA